MLEILILFALFAAVVVVGSLAVLIYDGVELMRRERREQLVRADAQRGPWGPR